jgi:hypothetical protein
MYSGDFGRYLRPEGGSRVKIHPKNFLLSLAAFRGYSTYEDRKELENIIFRCRNEVNFFQEFRPGSITDNWDFF